MRSHHEGPREAATFDRHGRLHRTHDRHRRQTTIYYNAGDGPVIGKVVPASGKTGGAAVSQVVMIPLRDQSEQEVTVCVTATDSDEREGPASP